MVHIWNFIAGLSTLHLIQIYAVKMFGSVQLKNLVNLIKLSPPDLMIVSMEGMKFPTWRLLRQCLGLKWASMTFPHLNKLYCNTPSSLLVLHRHCDCFFSKEGGGLGSLEQQRLFWWLVPIIWLSAPRITWWSFFRPACISVSTLYSSVVVRKWVSGRWFWSKKRRREK